MRRDRKLFYYTDSARALTVYETFKDQRRKTSLLRRNDDAREPRDPGSGSGTSFNDR